MNKAYYILITFLLSVHVIANNDLRYSIIPKPALMTEILGSFIIMKNSVVAVVIENGLFKEIDVFMELFDLFPSPIIITSEMKSTPVPSGRWLGGTSVKEGAIIKT